MPRRQECVVDVQDLLFDANTGNNRVPVKEGEVIQAVLAQALGLECREQRLNLARCLKVEVHEEKLAASVKHAKLVSVAVELNALDCSFLGVGLVRRRLLVQHPLIEALVSHLVEVPHAYESLGIAAQIDGQEGMGVHGVGVVVVRDPQIRIRLDHRG